MSRKKVVQPHYTEEKRKELRNQLGEERFIEFVALLLDGQATGVVANSTVLLPNGIEASAVCDSVWGAARLRLEIPLDADVSKAAGDIAAYQRKLRGRLMNGEPVERYLVDEYGLGRTANELARELSDGIEAWAEGQMEPKWELLQLDSFMRNRGSTPDGYEQYDFENLRRVIRYHSGGG
jgi:hypothetical protein